MNDRSLRIQRILSELSQAELGRRIGRSIAWVSLVERGYLKPTPEMLTAIQEILVKANQEDE